MEIQTEDSQILLKYKHIYTQVRTTIISNLKSLTDLQHTIDSSPYDSVQKLNPELESLRAQWKDLKEEVKSKQDKDEFLISLDNVKMRVDELDE